jgi:hypothetical protein
MAPRDSRKAGPRSPPARAASGAASRLASAGLSEPTGEALIYEHDRSERRYMTTRNCPPRLTVVAAIIDEDGALPNDLRSAARLGGRSGSVAEPDLAPTTTERALALALQGGQNTGETPAAEPVIAELLMLAEEESGADDLAVALSQAFLRPAGSGRDIARDEPRSAFADLYRRLALHQLNSQVRNKAAAILARLSASFG